MGLLDDAGSFLKTPEGIGLLSAAFGGMANARRGRPWNTLGAAGVSGLTGYASAQDQLLQMQQAEQMKQIRDMQMQTGAQQLAAMKLKAEDESRKREFLKTIPDFYQSPAQQALADGGGPTVENAAKIPSLKPQFDMQGFARGMLGIPGMEDEGLKILTQKQAPIKLGAEETLLDPTTFKQIATGPQKKDSIPSAIKEYEYAKGQGFSGSFQDFQTQMKKAGANVTPFYQFLPTAEGYAVGDARSGRITPGNIGGKAVIKASDDPNLQGKIAGAKEFSKTQAEDLAKAQGDYPRIVQNAETALKYADELMKHPGFSQAVGKSSMLGIQKIPGTDAKGFINRLDQIKGGAFLEAFNSLKGGGQITEIEGKKATDAIARMDNATSEEDFKAAVNDYKAIVRNGMNRAKMKARPVAPMAPPQAVQGGAKFLGFE